MSELRRALESAVLSIPEQYRLVLMMRDVEQLSTIETADALELSEENFRQLWVPAGLAHGFLVTSESADFLYKATHYYDPLAERSLRWDDPDLAIEWPLQGKTPSLSAKDSAGTSFKDLRINEIQSRP